MCRIQIAKKSIIQESMSNIKLPHLRIHVQIFFIPFTRNNKNKNLIKIIIIIVHFFLSVTPRHPRTSAAEEFTSGCLCSRGSCRDEKSTLKLCIRKNSRVIAQENKTSVVLTLNVATIAQKIKFIKSRYMSFYMYERQNEDTTQKSQVVLCANFPERSHYFEHLFDGFVIVLLLYVRTFFLIHATALHDCDCDTHHEQAKN